MMAPLIVERPRGLLRLTGRDPVGMIDGLATADIAAVTRDRGAYTVFLTPKGRIVADARVFLLDDDPATLLLDTEPGAVEPLSAHIAHYVPPLFARAEDVTSSRAVVGVHGPDADEVVEDVLPAVARPVGGEVEAEGADETGAVGEGERRVPAEAVVRIEDGFRARSYLTGDPGWDAFVAPDRVGALLDRLAEAGGRRSDPGELERLRIRAGVPRWGRELTGDVIPLEAGLLDRAISRAKGCYTGQEVIVRILHRGHVNRHLRRLEFDGDGPEPGTELFEAGVEKPRGVVTSVAESDGGAIGMGYVRREVEPPAELYAGSTDGPAVRVTTLG